MAQSDLLPRTSHFQLTTISRFTSSIEIVFVFSESTCFPKVLLGLSRPTFIQKTLVEIAMDLSTYSGSFLSIRTFPHLLGFWATVVPVSEVHLGGASHQFFLHDSLRRPGHRLETEE